MTNLGPIATIQPGSLPGQTAPQDGTDNPLGIFAALLAALSPGKPATPEGAAKPEILAQLAISGTEIPSDAAARPDLAAALGADVEVRVGEAAPAETALGEAPDAAPDAAIETTAIETTAIETTAIEQLVAGEHGEITDPLLPATASTGFVAADGAGSAQLLPQTPLAVVAEATTPKPAGLDQAAGKAGDTAGAAGIQNALTRGNRDGFAPGAGQSPRGGTDGVPADSYRPTLPGSRAGHEAALQAAQGSTDIDGNETAGRPGANLGTEGQRTQIAPSRPVLVHISAHPLTAQTLVSVQESPSAELIPLGANGGATQAANIKSASAPPPPSPGASPVPLNGIAVYIAQQAQTGARRFDIRLDPPELGRIEVRLVVNREGHVHTHLVVERSETLDLLQRDARQLERALQDAGLDTSQGSMKFSLKEHGSGQHGAREDMFGHPAGHDADTGDDEPADTPVWQGRVYAANGGLDIRI